jgi:isoleucyl-tRNA synthetase
LKYESAFDELPRVKKAFKELNYKHEVVAADGKAIIISEEEGTGMVHIAPGQGSEDFNLGKKLKLPAVDLIDEAANYLNDLGEFSGKNAKKNPGIIFDYLKNKNEGKFFFKKASYKHRYPHCWRCGEELVFRLVDEWYIKCSEIKPKLIAENKKVNWYPEYGKIRQEEWFKNMGDWLISRKRYYGLPLPVWECKCGNIEVIGSLKELKEKAVDKKKVDNLKEIHRPWIDEIKIKCPKCGKEAERILDVGDAWLDAGIVPFSTLNYLNDKSYWEEWFPADLISENMPGQSRGWFNALMWASVALTGKAPFKSLFGYETLKDEKGEEMHKSKGNAIWFDDAVEKMGADPIRLLYSLQDPSQELRVGSNVVKEPQNNINILFNIRKLIENAKETKISAVEDRWILSKLNFLAEYVTEELENLHPHNAARAIQNFWLNDFSRGYIQLIRDKLANEENAAQNTLKQVYLTLIKLCAPIIPFVTENIWQELKERKIVSGESVHLEDWPKADRKKIDEKLEEEFENMLKIIEAGMAERDKAKISLRWPLAETRVTGLKVSKELNEIILRQLNVKQIVFKTGKELSVELDTKLTPELEAEGYARELTRAIQAERKKAGLTKEDRIEIQIKMKNDLLTQLSRYKQFEVIQNKVNAKDISATADSTKDRSSQYNAEFKIKDEDFKIFFNKSKQA